MSEVLMRTLLALDAALYFSSSVLLVEKVKKRCEKGGRIAKNILYAMAVTLNLFLVAWNYIANRMENGVSYAPFVSMFQVLIFLAFCFCPVLFLVAKVCKNEDSRIYFTFIPGVVMLGPTFMDIADVWTFPPALQSVFFIPHIVCYMLSYTLAAAAFLMTVSGMIRGERYRETPITCVRILFPFMTAGLFLGAVWADQVWGEFWAWDVKECWSLCAWLAYTLCLHLARREKTKKYAEYLMIAGFVLVIVTFLFSNVLNVSSAHSYS